MDVQGVLPAHLQAHFPDGLNEGLGFDIADGAADFGDDHVRVGLFANPVNEALDFVGDVRDGLHRAAQISALTFLVDHIGVHLAGGQIGILVHILVNEALVMAQVQVGFRPVLGDLRLPVLVGTHGAGVYVDVGGQLLRRHL